MSKVYVIMGNDFPSAVFDSEEKAEAHVAEMREQDKVRHQKENPGMYYSPRIHWRHYEFELK